MRDALRQLSVIPSDTTDQKRTRPCIVAGQCAQVARCRSFRDRTVDRDFAHFNAQLTAHFQPTGSSPEHRKPPSRCNMSAPHGAGHTSSKCFDGWGRD